MKFLLHHACSLVINEKHNIRTCQTSIATNPCSRPPKRTCGNSSQDHHHPSLRTVKNRLHSGAARILIISQIDIEGQIQHDVKSYRKNRGEGGRPFKRKMPRDFFVGSLFLWGPTRRDWHEKPRMSRLAVSLES